MHALKVLPLLLLFLSACPGRDAPPPDKAPAPAPPAPAPAPPAPKPLTVAAADPAPKPMTPEAALLKARTATKALGLSLKKALLHAMREGGPESAITVCNEKAPQISEQIAAADRLQVRRVATRLRNPANAPDPWETRVIKAFERPATPGGKLEVQEHWEIIEEGGQKSLRYARSILTGPPCLACHGQDLDPALKAKIAKLYPADTATGFREGELRGIFSARVPLP